MKRSNMILIIAKSPGIRDLAILMSSPAIRHSMWPCYLHVGNPSFLGSVPVPFIVGQAPTFLVGYNNQD